MAESRWFAQLMVGFKSRFTTWSADPALHLYFEEFRRKPRFLRVAADAFLHISYDLPIVIAETLSGPNSPPERDRARITYIRPSVVFGDVLQLVAGQRRIVGLIAYLTYFPARRTLLRVFSTWAVALRTTAWVHGEILAERSHAERARLEGRLLRNITRAAATAARRRFVFGIPLFHNYELLGFVFPIWESLANPRLAATLVIAGILGAWAVANANLIARLDLLGSEVLFEASRAFDRDEDGDDWGVF